MKRSELKNLIKEELQSLLKEGSYEQSEIEAAEKDHDWTYKMGIKFFGSKNNSKNLQLDKKQFNEIKRILK